MNLADVAALAVVGAERIYRTSKAPAATVVIRSATVDNRGTLRIAVAYVDDDPRYTFNVSAFSLSIPQ